MMSNPWFRLYAEFASDHKMQMMSESFQRRYVMLLCLRCSNGDVTLQDQEVAFQLRISNEEWAETKAAFVDKKLIDKANRVLAWEKRQYISDSSVERVRRHREHKKQVCNVTVTPPDTDTDTEQKQIKQKTAVAVSVDMDLFEMFWETYDYKIGKHKAVKSWKTINPDGALAKRIIAAAGVYSRANPNRTYYKHPSTWLNGKHWEDDPAALMPKIARVQTQHQINQAATAKALFGTALPNRIIDVEATHAENAPPALG